jgi:hypothetical protein
MEVLTVAHYPRLAVVAAEPCGTLGLRRILVLALKTNGVQLSFRWHGDG